ncbi:MAG: hypothetical protein GY754_21805, partial [bacterium]|nr:hypothetical protein [bacterium]
YMLEDFNVQLRPIFFKQLKPGTRVVAHGFHMGDWEPDQEIYHKKARRRKIYYWVIPAQVQGKWKFNDITITGLNLKNIRLDIKQNFQKISGTVQISGEEKPLTMARLNGQKIELNWQGEVSGKKLKIEWNGIVHSDRIEGTQITTTGEGKPAASVAWKAVPEKSLAQKKEKENE